GGNAEQDDENTDSGRNDEVCELEPHAFLVPAFLRKVIEADQEKGCRHRFYRKLRQSEVRCPEEYEEECHRETDGTEHYDGHHARTRYKDDGCCNEYYKADDDFLYAYRCKAAEVHIEA